MKIKKAEFVGSFVREEKCPQVNLHEYAFIGRSNVGKSSLVNYLLNQKELAKVSGTPGKTQTINFFNVNDNWHLVDLPGYGYARISKGKREEWFKFIRYYLKNRKQLVCTFILIDSRILPQKADIEFINWMGESRLPFAIIFTKADKLKSPDLIVNTEAFKKKLLESWEELPPFFITSSFRKHGGETILQYVDECNHIILHEG
jgi:GTP-binding protein